VGIASRVFYDEYRSDAVILKFLIKRK